MTIPLRLHILTLTLALAACPQTPEPPKPRAAIAPADAAPVAAAPATGVAPWSRATASAPADGIAWRKGDVDAAFVAARAAHKPLFLYWGAVWCPPCTQVMPTLSNRQYFIERSRYFVPVYIDGDSPSAQKLGARFNVVGYPTMILFDPDGREIVRLPGEADPEQYMRVLTMGMNGARPVKDTLSAALSKGHGHAALSADDWRMLPYYSWVTDEQQLIPEKNVASTLKRLAQACPVEQKDTAVRLELKALAAGATAKGAKPSPDAAATAQLVSVLGDPQLVRENFDTLTEYADKIAGFVTPPKSAERERLVTAWAAALPRLVPGPGLSSTPRLVSGAALH